MSQTLILHETRRTKTQRTPTHGELEQRGTLSCLPSRANGLSEVVMRVVRKNNVPVLILKHSSGGNALEGEG